MAIHTILTLFVAGGATLLGFPILLSVGLPPSVANASNFVATMQGYAAAIPSYMGELRQMNSSAIVNTVSSVAGAAIGSILLIWGEDDVFAKLIPYLLLTATLLYAYSDKINRYFSREDSLLNVGDAWVGCWWLSMRKIRKENPATLSA